MIPYTILIFMILIYGLFEKSNIKIKVASNGYKSSNGLKITDIYLFVCFTVMFLLIAFRGDFSSDYQNYESHFYTAINLPWSEIFVDGFKVGGTGGVEVGFYVLMKIIGIFTSDPIWLFIIVTLLTLLPIFLAIRDESESKVLSLLLFVVFSFFLSSMNIMRSVFAYSLLFSARNLLYKKQYFQYICIIALVSTIHLSSLVMLLVVLLDMLKIKNKIYVILILPISLVLLQFGDQIILLGDQILYDGFFTTIYRHGIREATFGNIIAPLILGIFLVIGSLLIKEENRKYEIWLKATFLWVLFRVMMLDFIEMKRFADMMSPYMLLFFPYLINRLSVEGRLKTILKICLAMATIALFYYTMADSPYNPFYFIWERENY